jgi:hypothetical protein
VKHENRNCPDLGAIITALHDSEINGAVSVSWFFDGVWKVTLTATTKGQTPPRARWLHRAILLKLAGERVRSFAIITTTPDELCAELHNQMPVDPWAQCLVGLPR